MKVKIWLAVASLSLTCVAAVASPETDAQAVALLDSINMKTTFGQMIEKTLEIQLKQNPALVPYKDVMQRFFDKYMSYESMKGELIEIYSSAFTAQELKEIADFYRTDTGKKAISLMPELMAKGGALGARRIQEHLPEFKSMMSEESAKMKESHSKQ